MSKFKKKIGKFLKFFRWLSFFECFSWNSSLLMASLLMKFFLPHHIRRKKVYYCNMNHFYSNGFHAPSYENLIFLIHAIRAECVRAHICILRIHFLSFIRLVACTLLWKVRHEARYNKPELYNIRLAKA